MSHEPPNILETHREELREQEREALAPWGWMPKLFLLLGVLLAATVVSAQAILIVPSSIAPAPVVRLQATIASVFPFSLLPRVRSTALLGEDENRINVLVTGIGGAGHDGPYLTDTIILASYRPSTNTLSLLSIPRDLLVPDPAPNGRKINAVGAQEEATTPGSGLPVLASAVETLFGITIPYYARVDFEGFEKLIDQIGGITVVVEREFTDDRYPIIGKEKSKDLAQRYETITFQQGPARFDGATALKFARSRYGTNGEGSDFARMRRQQKVIAAVREKLGQPSLLRPRSLLAIANLLSNHVTTNIGTPELFRLQELLSSSPRIVAKSLDDTPEGGLEAFRGLDGAFLLRPRGGDPTLLLRSAAELFTEGHVVSNEIPLKIAVLNSTNETGLAARVGELLRKEGFEVAKLGNALVAAPFPTTTIYDQSNGRRRRDVERLAGIIGAVRATVPLPEPQNDVDAVIVLGTNAQRREPE